MPIMNGAQATSAIRNLGFNRLIFGLSGNALDDDRKTFLAAGADCVIPKPFRMPQLDALMKYIKTNVFKSDPSVSFVVCEFLKKFVHGYVFLSSHNNLPSNNNPCLLHIFMSSSPLLT